MTAPPTDPHAHLSAAHPRLAELITRVGRCPLRSDAIGPPHARAHFTGLVRAIVSQQLSSKAAETIFGRVHALGRGDDGAVEAVRLLAVPETRMREAGLSGQKMRYVRDLCEHQVRGELGLDRIHELDDEAIIERLCRVKGVGRWTAEMFLIFRLGRPDVLPVDDLGIRKGFVRLFGLRKDPPAERMIKLARPFQPYRSTFSWYLWRITEEKSDAG